MNSLTPFVFLFLAALLEASGDALVRSGLNTHATAARLAFFILGALVLFAYGLTVNLPSWDFGRLLGVYVVFFFLIAQAIAWLVFRQRPGNGVLLGGSLILVGGAIVAFVQ